jgi:hypothetical protein
MTGFGVSDQVGGDAVQPYPGDEKKLPDKPPIEDMPPEEGHDPPDDDVAEEDADPPEMMSDDEASADDTVDNEERDVSP